MVKIVWTNYAYLDLKDIQDYIAKDSKKYAHLQIRKLKGKTNILKINPQSGRIVPELCPKLIKRILENY
jgi:toxin ParE1/3/4